MLKAITSRLNNINISNDTAIVHSPSFRANENNSLERTPSDDSVETKNNHLGTKIAIGTASTVALLALADVLFAKGKHIKKLFGIAEKEAKNGVDNAINNSANEIKKPLEEVTGAVEESAEAKAARFERNRLAREERIAARKAEEAARAAEEEARIAAEKAEKYQRWRAYREVAPIANKDVRELTGEEVNALLKNYFGEAECGPARELIEFIRKEIAPNTDEVIKMKDIAKNLNAIETQQGSVGHFRKLLSNDRLSRTKQGELTMREIIDEISVLPKEAKEVLKSFYTKNELPLDISYNQYKEFVTPEVLEVAPFLKQMFGPSDKSAAKSFLEEAKEKMREFLLTKHPTTDELAQLAQNFKPKGPVS